MWLGHSAARSLSQEMRGPDDDVRVGLLRTSGSSTFFLRALFLRRRFRLTPLGLADRFDTLGPSPFLASGVGPVGQPSGLRRAVTLKVAHYPPALGRTRKR